MATRALVTGGSGYFGSLLRDRLRASGTPVRVFDQVDADDRGADVEFVQGDIRDAEAVAAACRNVDVVYHNVAQVPLAKDKRLFWSVNLQGTENLLRAASAAGVRKIVHTSSSAVFGIPAKNPVDESVAPRPVEEYGRAKLAAELAVRAMASQGRVDATIIRPRTILGHGRLGIFQILFEWVSEGRNIPVLGAGDNLYQFVHADDLANACILAASRPGFAVYNVGAERFGTMRETLEALCVHARSGSHVRGVPARLAATGMQIAGLFGLVPLAPYHWTMYGRSLYFDLTPVRRDLDWAPRWSNTEMIRESYDWYLAHRDALAARSGASAHRSAVNQGLLVLAKRLF